VQDWYESIKYALIILGADLVYVVLHNWLILLVLSLVFIIVYVAIKAARNTKTDHF